MAAKALSMELLKQILRLKQDGFSIKAIYKKKINSGGSKAFIIDATTDSCTTRLYIEFFLSPKGTFTFPPSILEGKLAVAQQIRLDDNLSLVIGLNHMKGMDEWHVDKEIAFIPNNI